MNKLAIVIPYYKIDFFEETLKSVAAQTDKRFTLYIGNDASPNDPLPLIQKYFPEGNYHYYHYPENLGGRNLAMQWERLLENVREEWFQILGDDDVIPADFSQRFQAALPVAEAEKISVIRFPHVWISDSGATIHTFPALPQMLEPSDYLIKKINGEITASLSENIFRTGSYRKYGFEKLPLAWGSDDIAVFAFANGRPILSLSGTPVSVRVSAGSISGSDKFDKAKKEAISEMKCLALTKYRDKIPADILLKIHDRYLYECYAKKLNPKYSASSFLLRQGKILDYLKAAKKTYEIKKRYA